MNILQSFFERQAKKLMTLHPTAKEYTPLLLLSVVGKIITMLLSVSGGVLYFAGILKDLYLPLVIFLSGVFLLLLEGLNLSSLEKALKMGLRSRFLPSALLGIFSLVLFAISFFITTEGIRQWKVEASTKEAEITFNYQKEKDEIKTEYTKRIERLQQASEPLTKYAWKSKQVAAYTIKIDSLEKALALHLGQLTQKEQTDQLQNTQQTEVKATRFYLIGVALMGGQLVFNVLIAVLYNRIHKENNQTQRIDEELNELRTSRLESFYSQMRKDFVDLETLFFQRLTLLGNTKALALASASTDESTISTDEPITSTEEQPEPNENDMPQELDTPKEQPKERAIGFHVPPSPKTYITAPIDTTRGKKDNTKEVSEKEKVKYTKICPNCNTGFIHKHHMQKYCSADCRIEFWERKTGKTLRYAKNKR